MSRAQLEAEYAAAKRDYDAALAKLRAAKAALGASLKAEADEREEQRLAIELAVLRAYVGGGKVKDLLSLMGRKGTSSSPVDSLISRLFLRFVPPERWCDEEFEIRYEENTPVRTYQEVHKNQARAVLAHLEAPVP